MTNQDIIDKYLKEFYEVQRLKVPIELNSYLHRMINEALRIHDVVGRSEQLQPEQECYKSGEPCKYGCSGLCKESC
jgi:hypothetical protein